MKTIYEAFDGRQFDTEKKCLAYEEQNRLEQKRKTIKTISNVDSYGWGETLEIYVDPLYQIVVELRDSYPHEGGVLFKGSMNEFINNFYEQYSKSNSKFALRIVKEMNNYKSGHSENTRCH